MNLVGKGAKKKKVKDMTKVRARLASGKVKKECCRSDPRCKSCPTVVHRLNRMNALELDDAALRIAVRNARRW